MLKVKIWLSQKWKKLPKWNKKTFFLLSKVFCFRHTKQTSKNVTKQTLQKCDGHNLYIAIMHGKDEFPKIKETICNIPIAAKNVCNILPRPKVSNQLLLN